MISDELHEIRRRAVDVTLAMQGLLDATPARHRPSARNLAHYLALRSHDLRQAQKHLARRGLSSLGRCEAAVLPSIDAVLRNLAVLDGSQPPPPHDPLDVVDLDHGHRLLDENSDAALGPRPPERAVRIMVTLPTEAAESPAFITDALAAGADLIRINTAHDSPDHWSSMIEHLNAAVRSTGRAARILLDLPGPKIRITEIQDARTPRTKIRVRRGDTIVLPTSHAKPAQMLPDAVLLNISHPEALAKVQIGHRVSFDDAKVSCIARDITGDAVVLFVERTPDDGAKLRKDKGMNLPDTDLNLAALAESDLEILQNFAHRVDLVGLSFARKARDILQLFDALNENQVAPGIVLKVETQQGFQNLPELLLTLLRWPTTAVMIARGDLAVECGFERLAEIQEEILWLCEAAHTPIIWATQVLESLAKSGLPSRAEITDAAMAQRAECVMLNKGPHAITAVRLLDDLLRRMAAHQRKKTPMFRALSIADGIIQAEPPREHQS